MRPGLGMIARLVGKGFLAAGFIMALSAQTDGARLAWPAGLALLGVGILVLGYGVWHTATSDRDAQAKD